MLGVCLLISQVLLCYSAAKKKRDSLTLFFILSMAVLVLYWVWFAYLKYGKGESEASKEVILAWPECRSRDLIIHYRCLILGDFSLSPIWSSSCQFYFCIEHSVKRNITTKLELMKKR